MPSKPAEHLKLISWRLDRSLLAAVQEAAGKRQEPVVTFVARALAHELDRVKPADG